MPSEFVRPKPSRVLELSPAALDAYRLAGWRLTEYGRLSSGVTSGPCARCQKPTERYGLGGTPWCPDCTSSNGRARAATEEAAATR